MHRCMEKKEGDKKTKTTKHVYDMPKVMYFIAFSILAACGVCSMYLWV